MTHALASGAAALALIAAGSFTPAPAQGASLEVVATFDARPGNVAVTPAGRIIVSMQPLDDPDLRVVEVGRDGALTPFPTRDWADGPGGEVGLSAVIGVASSSDGTVWMLDMGGPDVPAQMVGWDTVRDQLARRIEIPEGVLRPNSFLQDFALDEARGLAFIADMTLGNLDGPTEPAIVVLDLETGAARRVLQGHESFLPPDRDVRVGGGALVNRSQDGALTPLRFGLNPIAIDPEGEWVFFGTINGSRLYRVPAALLADPEASEAALAAAVEPWGAKAPSDGIEVGPDGRVYVTDIEGFSIGVATAEGYEVLLSDERLSWPDGLAFGPDGSLFVTQNDLHAHPAFNGGREAGAPPYHLLRLGAEALGEALDAAGGDDAAG